MTTICRIIRACSATPITFRLALGDSAVKLYKQSYNFHESLGFVNVRIMSQKSITSFFKITPKKAVEVKQESPPEDDSVASSPNESPVKTEKRSSKQQRLDSSEEDTAPTSLKAQTNSEKKKKAKRQRIDSSGSESELTGQKPEEQGIVLTKTSAPLKTYSSPRSKRKGKESPKEEESPKSDAKIKEEKATSETKTRKKTPVQKTPKTDKKTKKSVSPAQNGLSNGIGDNTPPKVKEEKVSPKSEKDIKSDKDNKVDKSGKKTEDKAKVVNGEKVADMADGDIEEKCEHLMNVVVESRKKFGKICVDYERKSLLMENRILKLKLETISNLRCKSKHTVPDSTQDREDMENFVVKIKERQQRIESLKKKLQNTQEVVLQLKTDNIGRQLRDPITAEAMLEKAKIKKLN